MEVIKALSLHQEGEGQAPCKRPGGGQSRKGRGTSSAWWEVGAVREAGSQDRWHRHPWKLQKKGVHSFGSWVRRKTCSLGASEQADTWIARGIFKDH